MEPEASFWTPKVVMANGEAMIEAKRYLSSVLETNLGKDILYTASRLIAQPEVIGTDLLFQVSMVRKIGLPGLLYFDQREGEMKAETDRVLHFRIRFYGDDILRLMISPTPQRFQESSLMLDLDPALRPGKPLLEGAPDGWKFASDGEAFFTIQREQFASTFSPDGLTNLQFQNLDQFLPDLQDALPVVRLERSDGTSLTGIALHIQPGEHFCGTGERFERPDLFGQQIDLVNFDAAGVNNPRAYKNIPFLLSSRGYGLFVHSSAKMRLDIGAHSTRSLQWLVEDDVLDVFVIGGGSLQKVLQNYRRLTGIPAMPPLWSFGVWMSRASYYSEAEVSEVARRMRAEGFPGDVLHLDIGWFRKEWVCDWQFSPDTFPDPEGMFRRLDEQGFKVSLWQFPHIHTETDLVKTALEKGYVGKETPASKRHWLGYTLDFTNPAATAWYQTLIEGLMRMGAAAIKADFGEDVDEGAIYAEMSGRRYHNLFALLYQKAVWDATERVHGKGNAVIWARAAWAGCQRFPVHWGGDAAATFDGLAGTILGGLHFGLSGFAFWSHDVGGIHGIPDFMSSRPSDEVYVRWTQVGVFSSHMRYHGGTPREPWEYPAVAGIVREWLHFRYSLLPYLLDQSRRCLANGLPVFRSIVIDWPHDPAAWSITDEYLFGDSFLVCPVLNSEGVRDVYLPEGKWVDFWSGGVQTGPLHLHGVRSSLARLPLFIRHGALVTFSEPVEHTRSLAQAPTIAIQFDDTYPGYERTPLRDWITL